MTMHRTVIGDDVIRFSWYGSICSGDLLVNALHAFSLYGLLTTVPFMTAQYTGVKLPKEL